jgi:wyosine [tRNA(Phe)-imidazoG37] synthetase (radical SAM superfamily)
MTFQICQISPIYCQITDGHVGSKAKILPMTYYTEKLAHKLAAKMTQNDYDGYGDDHFAVVKTGDNPFRYRSLPIVDALDDEIPF